MIAVDTSISRIISSLKNPLVFGLISGMAVALTIILVATAGKGSFQEGVSMYLSNGIFTYLVPAAVAVQMGLFRHHRS